MQNRIFAERSNVSRREPSLPGRLTRQLYEGGLAGGVSGAEHVGTVGVMATVSAIGRFCDALGVATPRAAGTHRQ